MEGKSLIRLIEAAPDRFLLQRWSLCSRGSPGPLHRRQGGFNRRWQKGHRRTPTVSCWGMREIKSDWEGAEDLGFPEGTPGGFIELREGWFVIGYYDDVSRGSGHESLHIWIRTDAIEIVYAFRMVAGIRVGQDRRRATWPDGFCVLSIMGKKTMSFFFLATRTGKLAGVGCSWASAGCGLGLAAGLLPPAW
jgi:hypothetical protein